MAGKSSGVWRWIAVGAGMLAWLAVVTLSLLSRIAHSPVGVSAEATVAVLVVTATLTVIGIVLWVLVRPNVIRSRSLQATFPDGLVFTIRRTSDVMDAVAALDPKSLEGVGGSAIGLWLTALATPDELTIWAGKTAPVRILAVPSHAIESASPARQQDSQLFTQLPFAGIAIRVRTRDAVVDLPLIPSSALLGGAYPALPKRVKALSELIDRLVARNV